ncbi:DUF1799 domain-containing protein [Acidovorax sp. sif1233]|uniref:DUF1799 domain-containing protein n=1 Tax=Acidovorax sp. sif1233 TaxID=2854792 RepID=UPI001C46E77A|nr:DUF1799 domain-containing protein [Acidovorax sp. sif1233]
MDPALEAGMRAFGATDADVEKVRQERGSAEKSVQGVEFEVWEENWELWLFFLAAQTQWNYVSGGLGPAVRVGMNFTGVESVARIRGISGQQLQAWAEDLQSIELAVLQADREVALKRRPNKRA